MLVAMLLLSFNRVVFGAELTFPSEKLASAGSHTLSIEPVIFDPTYGFQTRGFDGGVPGPTFRMNPGETLTITVTNNLDASNSADCLITDGQFCEAAATNLHTHGLHVSSKGVSDGLSANSDDIFVNIEPGRPGEPGESADYAFIIPDSHMPGTHWYHPHRHHATALQAGGGAAGALIVNDPPDYLPAAYANMIEKILFISGHNLVTLQTMAVSAKSGLLETAATTADNANLDTNVILVNGQIGATMTLSSHSWYRFRMVFAAVEQQLQLSVTGDAICTLKLLAKDGIYLTDMPRDITTIHLFPGARADVAVFCTCATYPCSGTLVSGGGRRLQGGRGPGGPGMDVVAATVLSLSVTETPGGSAEILPTVSLARPCYLVDLQSATVPNGNTGNLDLDGGARAVRWNNQGASMTYENVHANGGTMASWSALTDFTVGSVYEITVTGANAHPLHIHVNPFQITSMPETSYHDGYFRIGDWHDTLMVNDLGGGASMNIRMQTDQFTGKAVVHCHILEHEDEGMMAFFSITGTEGTTWSGATASDANCYSSVYDSSVNNWSLSDGDNSLLSGAFKPNGFRVLSLVALFFAEMFVFAFFMA